MPNIKLLKQKIAYEGIKLQVISYRIGISRTTLWSRLSNRSEFTKDEIRDICLLLRLNAKEREAIFDYDPFKNDISRRKTGRYRND